MTRFDEVTRLKDLGKKAEPGWIKGDMGSIYCARSPDKYPLLTPYGINNAAPEIRLAPPAEGSGDHGGVRMTPEEIEAICSFVGIRQYWGDLSNEQLYQRINKYHEWLNGLCDHVECQAKRITELEAQVAALQEIAVSERTNTLFNGPWDSGLPVGSSYDAVMAKAKEDARRQLAEKHPEVDWK